MVTASYSARSELHYLVTVHQVGIQLQSTAFSTHPNLNAAASWLQSNFCCAQSIKRMNQCYSASSEVAENPEDSVPEGLC